MAETVDDAAQPSSVLPLRRSQQLVLAFEADRPLSGGARWSLDDIDEVHIGRGVERCVTRVTEGGRRILRLSVPGGSISSRHVRLLRERGGWSVEDLGSRNGTTVNGARVERAALQPNDIIEFGRAHVLLREYLLGDGDPNDWAPTPGGQLDTLVPILAARLRDLVRVGASSVPVLILGETGTGKEVVARAIHATSQRQGRFVAVNCGALSEGVLTAQLFGHMRGAFSGAVRDEPGLVRESDGGTLFLDEIGELPLSFQAALLRVLQEGEVLPVGGTRAVRVNLRVVAATHRSLDADVASGRFRADLLARISGFTLSLPPLRERREDFGIIVASMLPELDPQRASEVTFAADAAQVLLRHSWPHNIRELRQLLATALVLAPDRKITLARLPAKLTDTTPLDEDDIADDNKLRATLVAELTTERGNVTAVARTMGKAPIQIRRWMKRLGIDPDTFRG